MYKDENIKMGRMPEQWKEGVAKSITICVTEDCNLSCKYCYMTGKNSSTRLDFNVAKKAIDYILTNREDFNDEAVCWEFIGGEPFLEIDLIDKICDYIKLQMYILCHPWFNNYLFNFSTNGLLYNTPKVQDFIKKNREHISIGISIDGNKIKHDLQRVYPDGRGSYDDVVKNVPLWQKQFPGFSTKATFSHEDIPYLKDSIISLWSLGINMVMANVVFEDVWHDGDDEIFESQLKELADYILENNMWKDYSVRFFDPNIGMPYIKPDLLRNSCGSGRMLAIDCKGKLYPCIRFYEMSLCKREKYDIGDVFNGVNNDKVRPFLSLTTEAQSKDECLSCDVATGCSWCVGCNYDMADSETIFQRTTFICKMHKANVRANNYFWDKFEKVTGLPSETKKLKLKRNKNIKQHTPKTKYLQFITNDNITPSCGYINMNTSNNKMDEITYNEGLQFAQKNGLIPIMIGTPEFLSKEKSNDYMWIVDSDENKECTSPLLVYDNCFDNTEHSTSNCILLVSKDNISNIHLWVSELFNTTKRVNLMLQNIYEWNDTDVVIYEHELEMLIQHIFDLYKNEKLVEMNVLTDIWDMKSMCNCSAGEQVFTLAPNGKLYLCPAWYFDDPSNHIGDLKCGINIKNEELLKVEKAPICSFCDVYNCNRCKYLNKKLTGNINIPSKIQCTISHIERKKSQKLQNRLLEAKLINPVNILVDIDYKDPLELLKRKLFR